MQELDDIALLKEFVERHSEDAFAALVSRHVNKVYSVALRHTRNPHQAEEITQAVFVILARKSRSLSQRVVLAGWLHETARLTAVTFIRGEFRRTRREREAYMQNSLNEGGADVWPHVAPLLDSALSRLSERDRNVILLRYFDDKSMKEVGAALGANEETAKKRVNRAVEKLRLFFTKRGVVVSGAVLTAAISAHSVQAAPVALAKSATTVALAKGSFAAASTPTLVKGTLNLMMWLKTKTTLFICAIALTAAGGVDIVIKNFVHTPGGAQTMDALEALKTLRMKNQLPGYTLGTNVGSGFMIPGLVYAKDKKSWQMTGTNLDAYPVYRTFKFITNAQAGFIWNYTVAKASEKANWQVEKAWQTDQDGKTVAEFPIQGQ